MPGTCCMSRSEAPSFQSLPAAFVAWLGRCRHRWAVPPAVGGGTAAKPPREAAGVKACSLNPTKVAGEPGNGAEAASICWQLLIALLLALQARQRPRANHAVHVRPQPCRSSVYLLPATLHIQPLRCCHEWLVAVCGYGVCTLRNNMFYKHCTLEAHRQQEHKE